MNRGERPNWVARILNGISEVIHSSGIISDWATLEVVGRKSGRTISLPVVMLLFNGERYLVSMLGEDANWVRNVRAANGKAVIRHGRRQDVRLEDVPVEQRAPIIKAYLGRAPGARPHIPVNKDAPLADFEKIAGDFPIFRVIKV
jgi:deazaflavin-dependent oxidoreductase (nitroreductase family)